MHERALAVGQRDAELPRADAEVDVLEGGLAELRVEVERRGGGAGRGGGSGGGGLAALRLRRRRRAQSEREVARAAVQQRPVGQHAPVECPGAVVELVDQTGLGLSVRGRGGGDELGGERLGLGAVGLGAPADDPATRRVLLLPDERLEPGRGRGAVGVGERDNGGARGRSGVEASVPRRGGAGVCGVAQQAVGQLFFFFFFKFFLVSFRESSSSEPSARRSSEKETTTTDSRRKRDARKEEKEKGRKKKRKKRGVSSTSPRLPKPRRFPDSPTPSLLLQLDALASPSSLFLNPPFFFYLTCVSSPVSGLTAPSSTTISASGGRDCRERAATQSERLRRSALVRARAAMTTTRTSPSAGEGRRRSGMELAVTLSGGGASACVVGGMS